MQVLRPLRPRAPLLPVRWLISLPTRSASEISRPATVPRMMRSACKRPSPTRAPTARRWISATTVASLVRSSPCRAIRFPCGRIMEPEASSSRARRRTVLASRSPPRGYNAGVYDTVFIDGLTIYAGAAHNSADAAIKAVWQTRVANGNQMLGISNVRVLPDTFGTHSFAKALYLDSAFNGVVDNFFALGNSSATGTAMYVTQSISITLNRPDVIGTVSPRSSPRAPALPSRRACISTMQRSTTLISAC
jgi:hypothetical protein